MKGSLSTTSFGFSRKSIINEVERICKSEQFANSKQLQDFLRYLIDETLAGRKSQIKAYSIATEVFGRDKDFNPDIDPIVRVEARRLRKKLIEYYTISGEVSNIRIDIPTGRYVPTFTKFKAVGCLVPEKVNKSQQPKLAETPFDRIRPSIAVLPFVNLGLGPEKEFFSTGLCEQISSSLSKFQELEVINLYRW